MATTTPTETVTRNIAGHLLTLTAGVRYVADRPFAKLERTDYPVSIRRHDLPFSDPVAVVAGLNYDESNRLINAFNNGYMSFDGRVW